MGVEVKETTYEVDGYKEPCFEVTDGYTLVRIAPCYHLIWKDAILITEYLDGEFNSSEELDYEWNDIDEEEALDIAKRYSAYL